MKTVDRKGKWHLVAVVGVYLFAPGQAHAGVSCDKINAAASAAVDRAVSNAQSQAENIKKPENAITACLSQVMDPGASVGLSMPNVDTLIGGLGDRLCSAAQDAVADSLSFDFGVSNTDLGVGIGVSAGANHGGGTDEANFHVNDTGNQMAAEIVNRTLPVYHSPDFSHFEDYRSE